ncbi:hypothetical protein CAOG_00932 [Capsaspora owczarzaki ATCC 30864]|uniref:Transmembrane protein 43 n=1 Tax=Capsaspora owczarzaki (strain ATCC 30864) TaxID=595528 RepID=A0A0D2WI47_CAPO3|nr:hypothetical protein CAOG_00932 [Capsaspora owczarzaki ATCC 30864]KJE89470.1 hypothetical protein CAOG_000932 [Capsaspora owczarzaki ATCC 30864]|eukprot:XP_004365803.2 hypothetical protein CAOG_00932 [Capsaspora owczarzaki ATCC 30864]
MSMSQSGGGGGYGGSSGYSHTRTTFRQDQGFFSRVGNSLGGIVFGTLLIAGACFLLFWNEGNTVHMAQALDEGLRKVVALASSERESTHTDGSLVYLTGLLHAASNVADAAFGISIQAARLERTVEMYQWVETTTTHRFNEPGGTREEISYYYEKHWRSDLVSHRTFDNPFGHENPSDFAFPSRSFTADKVAVGRYQLSSSLIDQIVDWHTVDLTHHTQIPSTNGKSVFVQDGSLYIVQHRGDLQAGDLRIRFRYAGNTDKHASPSSVSVIARQSGKRLEPYLSHGHTLEFLVSGVRSAEDILSAEQAKNVVQSWAFRFVGWLLMFFGFAAATSIVGVLVDWIPIVRTIVGFGVLLINLTLATSLSFVVIALGWIRYRPLVGGLLLLLAIGIPFVLGKMRGPKTVQPQQQQPYQQAPQAQQFQPPKYE